MSWFYETSIYVTLPLFVGGFVIVSCALVVALRPVVARLADDPEQWDRVLGFVAGTFGVFFGILLALVALSAYENFADTHTVSLVEAAKVGALYRSTTGLPEEVGGAMRTTLDQYMNTVIDQDFPAQQRTQLPEASAVHVDEFEHLLHSFEPQTLQQQAAYLQLLSTFDGFIEARRERIEATALELPVVFWAVIWVGAAINAILIASIKVKDLRVHLVIAGLLALFIGLVMFVTTDMDHPYAGSISVGPGPFERVLEQVFE